MPLNGSCATVRRMPAASATKLFAIVGDPVAHSLSPVMHNAAIAALGLDARYAALRTTHQAFPALVRELLEQGGGCNVTRPFKDDAYALAGAHTDVARRTRAVNCVAGEPDNPLLDNTDVVGIEGALHALLGDRPVTSALILGTGGSGRAAAVSLADAWPGCQVTVRSRSAENRAAFLRWAQEAGVPMREHVEQPQVIINATPAEDSPDPGSGGVYLDLKYAAGCTASVRRARDAGMLAADGRELLVCQGVAAFERFFGVTPPIEVMRAAVEDALAP
jgi:shikimate dehydrogenase